MTENMDLSKLVNQNSYLGFAASTGGSFQLNCMLRLNLTVEKLSCGEDQTSRGNKGMNIGVRVGLEVSGTVILVVGMMGLAYYFYQRQRVASNSSILGALKSLPDTLREFKFNELKNATNNFDEEKKLGHEGFGVVYRGLLPKERVKISVNIFSRENLKDKDDLLSKCNFLPRSRGGRL